MYKGFKYSEETKRKIVLARAKQEINLNDFKKKLKWNSLPYLFFYFY